MNQHFPALDVQPTDLSEIEKSHLLHFERGATRVMQPQMTDRLRKFGLIEQRNGQWALTQRGRSFCRIYATRGPAATG